MEGYKPYGQFHRDIVWLQCFTGVTCLLILFKIWVSIICPCARLLPEHFVILHLHPCMVRSDDSVSVVHMRLTHSIACRLSWASLLRLLSTCLIAVSLTSCAPVFLYRHADHLVLWKIDEYLELSSDQKAFVRERLRVLLAQHRAEALPIYEGFLVEVKEKIANGVDRQEIEWMFSTYEALRVDLFQRLVPDGAALLSSLTDKQVRYLETRLERDSHKTARRLQDDTDSRLSARASTTLDWLKDWLGPLTKAQQLRIAELSRALPDMVPARMDHQRHWHREFIELLTSTREPQSISRYLKRSLFFPERTVRQTINTRYIT